MSQRLFLIALLTTLTLCFTPSTQAQRSQWVIRRPKASRLITTGTKVKRKTIVCYQKKKRAVPGIKRRKAWIHWKKAFKKKLDRLRNKGAKKKIRRFKRKLKKACQSGGSPTPTPIPTPPGGFEDDYFTATYYVDKNHPQASDSNDGSEASPFLTIEQALNTVQPKQRVIIKGNPDSSSAAAIYDRSGRSGLPIQTAGTGDGWIVIMANPGDEVVLEGSYSRNGIDLDNASFNLIYGFTIRKFRKATEGWAAKTDITIEQCEFSDTTETGLRLRNVTNITMRDTYVHHCFETGISVRDGKNILFERVESSYNSDGRGASGDGDGFATATTDNFICRGCIARNNSEDGFDLTSNGALINSLSSGHTACNIKLWRRVADNYAPKRTDIINTLVFEAGEAGIKVSRGAELHLYNSTIYANGEEGIAFRDPNSGASPDIITETVNSEIVNTIIVGNGTAIRVDGSDINTVDASNNLYYQNSSGSTNLNSDTAAVTGSDPLFFSPSTADFHLRANSPALNSGANQSAISKYFTPSCTSDRDGDCRESGAWDIGVDERLSNETSTAPAFTENPPAALSVNEGETVSYDFSAEDPDGDSPLFYLAGGDLLSEMKIDAKTGKFTFTPTYDQGGDTTSPTLTYNITIGVTDSYYTEPPSQTNVKITVNNVNRPPEYTGLTHYSLVEGRPWVFNVSVSDPDKDSFNASLSGLPASANVLKQNNRLEIYWTPLPSEVGTYPTTLSLSDGADNTNANINLEVLPKTPYKEPANEANIFYVDGTNGSDSNDGQTPASAWKTIQKAKNTLTAGQMVLVMEGTYKEYGSVGNSGAAGAFIIYKNYPGHAVKMDGTGFSSPEAFNFPSGRSHIVIDGFELANFGETIYFRGSNSNIILNNLHIHDGNQGIQGGASDLRVENTVIEDIGDRGIYGSNQNIHLYNVTIDTVEDRGLSMFSDSTDNVNIIGCDISGAGRMGIGISGRNVLIMNSKIHNNTSYGLLLQSSSNYVFNSIVAESRGNSSENIRLYSGNHLKLFNSVVTGSDRRGLYLSGNSSAVIRNSIIYNHTESDLFQAAAASLDKSYNLIGTDPLFQNSGSGNYKLQSGSPGRNTGTALPSFGITSDLEGTARPQEGAYDIGAYEFVP